MEKQRQSNFELLRLFCMLMVLVCHANGYVNEADLSGSTGVVRLLINQFCLVCVNVFVMISGWFGVNASWKGAFKLWFQVLYVTAFCVVVALFAGIPISFKADVLSYVFLGSGYWFVVSYLILYALAPVLNSFAATTSRQTFQGVLFAWFLAEFAYGFLGGQGYFDRGFSPLFFIGLYLLARYVRLYPERVFTFKGGTDISIYTAACLLSALLFWFGYKWFGKGFHLNQYDSPLAIIASLYFLLAFSKMHFSKTWINWMASSAFAIYLIHVHSLFYPTFKSWVAQIRDAYGLYSIGPLLVFILAIAVACILIDKPRIWLWDRLNCKRVKA